MIVERRAGYLTFSFEPNDWTMYPVEKFLDDFKDQVPPCFRRFDNNTKWWSLLDSENHPELIETFYALRKKYFEDENQENLEL